MQVGDQVKYVPAMCYARDPNPGGGYPWDMGRKIVRRENNQMVEVIEKVTGNELGKLVATAKRGGANKLVLIAPNCVWNAVVTAVNEDGTVNLDVQSNNGGVTLHEDNVKISDAKEPDTCHA